MILRRKNKYYQRKKLTLYQIFEFYLKLEEGKQEFFHFQFEILLTHHYFEE